MATSTDDHGEQPWLLLIHQIPPKPDYFRVKIGRRLARIGAVAIKNSVYVLPATDQAMEDFQWVRREIVDGGGEASISRSTFVEGLSDGDIERLFHDARSPEYEEIAGQARAALAALDAPRSEQRPTPEQRAASADALAKLDRRLTAAARIDFFAAPQRDVAREALEALERRLRATPEAAVTHARRAERGEFRGRTWVTRQGIFVDRIASAWLIARFIDTEARFRFVPAAGYRSRKDELRFDMYDAEFTHVGDACTFEVLLDRFGLRDDPALHAIAEVVHDIDLKDGKFARDDAPGIERVLAGIVRAYPDDAARLERGRQLFDELYALHAEDGP